VRFRQEWIAPHFIRCGFYTAVASTAGRADHQEWIVPRSIARYGLDTMSSSHQDPVCKSCARGPSFWHASLSGDKHRHLQRVVRLQKTILAYILFAAATIASLVRANQRNGSSSFFLHYEEGKPPAGPPTGPSCGLQLYYSPRAPEGGSILKAPPLPERSGQGQLRLIFKDPCAIFASLKICVPQALRSWAPGF
jgi:hypothetical protein